jgi:hypothetical protein
MNMESFVFTIKNPHNLRAQIFKQKDGVQAVNHRASYGPTFGCGCDFHICDRCRLDTVETPTAVIRISARHTQMRRELQGKKF